MDRHLRALVLGAALATGLVGSAVAAKTTATIGMRLEPPHLDPTAGAAAAIDEIVYQNIFEGLTQIDESGQVQPDLAESWTISEDGLTYTFKLRDGVTFHDGTSFDAEDVKFSFERAKAEDSTNAQKRIFEPIESITAVDPTTVEIKLSRPAGSFLFDLGWGDAVIVAPESADTNKTDPVGTGAFKFDRWVKGDRVEISSFDDYWGTSAKLTGATFKFIGDPAAALAAVLAGDVDAFPNFPATENLPQLEADPRFDVVVGTTEGETILALNNKRPPFDNKKVRQAISHAIDRQAVIDGAMFGYGTPIGSHFAPHNPAYVDLTGLYAYDPAKAKALLDEAGDGDGFKATLKLPPTTYARRSGEIIASELGKIGIEVEIIPVEWAQWLEEVFRGGDFDMTIVSHTEPLDIDIYARDDYYFGYDNPEFDAIIEKLQSEADTDARNALYEQAQRMIAEDAVNAFLFQLPKAGVWDKNLKGLWANAPIQANDLTDASWQQ
ncbi:ABC transporter substrate-binding protein [Amorphus sp. 3PC139-8]|uniref:ABC transporter substrate-binding protein n=1 Tax=Amorphus sp. 3PC139-8 TaxID=2735676 RepID=UPI00345CED13